MSILHRILEPPSYGYTKNGQFYRPTQKELLQEFLNRLNLFKSRKNWLQVLTWVQGTLVLFVFFVIFIKNNCCVSLTIIGLIYSLVFLSTHQTIYYHRYGTHRAYQFRNSFWRFIVRNLVIKLIPEETYIIAHHVHHYLSDKPGDPYNVHGGWLYCFLADANHQMMARDLSEQDYGQLKKLIQHTGVRLNSYAQYKKWGTICHPVYTTLHFILNWTFWYGAFFLIGGFALANAIFGMSLIWIFGIRSFNYSGHGRGKNKQRERVDFNKKDLSINQFFPGYVAGEWHNNHHLYPHSARSGFLWYQLDLAWLFIRFYYFIGGISSYKDNKIDFVEMRKHSIIPIKEQTFVQPHD